MTTPMHLRVDPDQLRDLGSAWHTLVDSGCSGGGGSFVAFILLGGAMSG